MTRLIEWEPKPEYRVSSAKNYGEGGRYSSQDRALDGQAAELTHQQKITLLPALLTSDDVLDRVLAGTILANLSVTLPEVWCVVETEESPNLNREPRMLTPYRAEGHVWSAHVDKDDAEAWCVVLQQNCDAQAAKNGWGEQSRRTFDVQRVSGAGVGTLRQPGADPERYCDAFRR